MSTATENSWSREAWAKSLPVYERILQLPFLQRLAEGTLPRACFNHYIGQDALYLNEYSHVLAHIASRVPSPELMDTFLRFARDGVMVEKSLHALFVDGTPDQMSDTCLHYTSLLKAQALEDVAVRVRRNSAVFLDLPRGGTPYHRYRTNGRGSPTPPGFRPMPTRGSTPRPTSPSISATGCAANASAETRRRMTEVFYQASRMERGILAGPYAVR